MEFRPQTTDPSVFLHSALKIRIGVFVDDILASSPNINHLREFKRLLAQQFNINDLGELNNFLGLHIIYNRERGEMLILQGSYIDKILKEYRFENVISAPTPMITNQKFVTSFSEEHLSPNVPYRAAIGSLLFVSKGTRPDILFAVLTWLNIVIHSQRTLDCSEACASIFKKNEEICNTL